MSYPGAAIRIVDLHVTRGSREVVNSVTLSVPAGALIGILGPSGCGKSTLMRAIVGVQKVASGTITVRNYPSDLQPHHGRSDPLRPVHTHAARGDPRRRNTGRTPGKDWHH
ncbi:ATP-binding cassette domain-containing protein [Frigoribacterium sp. CG_9.8]|uniref:ATP-binding cassette domain-containing protein n=1 Tax=Frigoribacterium sp. CG_9.8 TaxID=2787733 RepID=UPI001E29D9AF|nr:ATP-binding cassette domain-containing protein [Frigoribacterium sp. CG_9.8]